MLVFLITKATYRYRVAEPVEATRTKIPNLGRSWARLLDASSWMLDAGHWIFDAGLLDHKGNIPIPGG
jgi:hypothetical protein